MYVKLYEEINEIKWKLFLFIFLELAVDKISFFFYFSMACGQCGADYYKFSYLIYNNQFNMDNHIKFSKMSGSHNC